ncbi:MAG: hypothetical protein LUE26_00240, partial [Alistipes sp.]|nr:hypothetical protein [Alistipes sp.]
TEANTGTSPIPETHTSTCPAPDIYIYTDTGNGTNGTNTSTAPDTDTHTNTTSDTHADTNTGTNKTTGPGVFPLTPGTVQFTDHGPRPTAKAGLDSDPEPAVEPSSPYDLIVCNPPYFTSSLLPPDRGRVLARHDTSLDREELFRCTAALSRPGTLLALIVPAEKATDYIISADLGGFGLIRRTDVRTTPTSPPKRSLLEFRSGPRPAVDTPPAETLVIETSPLNYTEEYRTLTREFYLKF